MHYSRLLILALCGLFPFFYTQAQSLPKETSNIALLRTVFHSSSYDVHTCGHLVADGNKETFWESNKGDNQWLFTKLSSPETINQIIIYWGYNKATKIKLVTYLRNTETEVYTFILNKDTKIDTIRIKNKPNDAYRLEMDQAANAERGVVIHEIEATGEENNDEGRFANPLPLKVNNQILNLNGNHWQIIQAGNVHDIGERISQPDYLTKKWIPATVPGTILDAYYRFGALPDPLYADNMHQISDRYFSGNDFWYRSTFIPDSAFYNQKVYLNFNGINWKADIYLNGSSVGKLQGAFLRGKFDITALVQPGKINAIAIKVYHVDYWQSSPHKTEKKYLGAKTTNGDMSGLSSPTFLAASGWNWLPIVRGRNTGIWNDVFLTITGPLKIHDPWIESKLNLPDTTEAILKLHTTIENTSPDTITAVVRWHIENKIFETQIKMQAYETKEITITEQEDKNLQWKAPKLWWPNGYGNQNLYKATVQVCTPDKVSDSYAWAFGIRQISYQIKENILYLFCNGVRILVRGGNWGLPEALLRCNETDYLMKLTLHKDANLNMIRNWVGQTAHETFYKICDSLGIMIWDDFWLANPVDGPEPEDQQMFMANVRDKIKRVRKHPSLVLYCGRNEGLPPLTLDTAMQQAIKVLDPNRLYIPNSAAGVVTGLGPYNMQPAAWYFANRGKTFHSEQGIVAFPEAETVRKMMPEKFHWPINDMWAIHDYQFDRSNLFTIRLEKTYGKPDNLDAYCEKAQLLNYESAKAMMECLQSNQGSGMLLWMTQSAWPSMICQLYDYYMHYTSAFFAVKKGASPVHVFRDANSGQVKIANNTAGFLKNITVKMQWIHVSGKQVSEKTKTISTVAPGATVIFEQVDLPENMLHFLAIEALENTNIIADNFYWVYHPDAENIFKDLEKTTLHVTNELSSNDRHICSIHIKNTGHTVALLTTIKVRNKQDMSLVTPVIFSDNYFSLLPGQEKIVKIESLITNIAKEEMLIEIKAHNTDLKQMKL